MTLLIPINSRSFWGCLGLFNLLRLGIHDIEKAAREETQQQQGSDPDSGEDLVPTPPESPVPSSGAFAEHAGGLNLDDEFFAIPSSTGII